MADLRNDLRLASLMCLFVLAGCSERPKTVTMLAQNCQRIPTEEVRERRVRTTCAMRVGMSMNPGKPCLTWHHKDITERRYVLQCVDDEWRRE